MKAYKTNDLLDNIINDSIWLRNDFRANSVEYKGILELREYLRTSLFSDKTIRALESKGIEFSITEGLIPEIVLNLSAEEADAYNWNHVIIPYRVGQIHAIIDAVFYKHWDVSRLAAYPSSQKTIYQSFYTRLVYYDGFIFQSYTESIFKEDPRSGYEEIMHVSGSPEGYNAAVCYIRYYWLAKNILYLISDNPSLMDTIVKQIGKSEEICRQIISREIYDYDAIQEMANLLNLDSSDERILYEIQNEILLSTPDFYTMYIPDIMRRHLQKRIDSCDRLTK